MRLFQYEWRKLASRPLLFCLLAVLLAGNIYLFYNQTQKQEYAPLSGSLMSSFWKAVPIWIRKRRWKKYKS